MADAPHVELRWRHDDLLEGRGSAEVCPERPVDQQHVETEKADHWPGAEQEEHHTGDEAEAGHQ